MDSYKAVNGKESESKSLESDTEYINLLREKNAKEIDLKLSETILAINKDKLNLVQYFLPTFLTSLAIFVAIPGYYSYNQLSEFKQNTQKQIDDFTGKSPDKPKLFLLGINGKPLDNQTLEIKKVWISYKTDNNVKLSKPRYSYFVSIIIKNEGKGLVDSEKAVFVLYNNVSDSQTGSDDPNFNNTDDILISKNDSLTKISSGKSIIHRITRGTPDKPEPGKKEAFKYKIIYGDQDISIPFNIEFAKSLKFEDNDTP